MDDDFIITVFSNSNTNTYNNTLTSFSNDLPKIFDLKQIGTYVSKCWIFNKE